MTTKKNYIDFKIATTVKCECGGNMTTLGPPDAEWICEKCENKITIPTHAELQRERDDWRKRWAVENENLDKASTEVARLMGEVERWKRAAHEMVSDGGGAIFSDVTMGLEPAVIDALLRGDIEALEYVLGVKP